MWEQQLLLWLHSHQTHFLDRLFLFTDLIGRSVSLTILVVIVATWHLLRKERRQALAWVVVGICILCLKFLLKLAVARARPTLWPPLVIETDYSFPSGHALGTAAFYPLLVWTLVSARSKWKRLWMGLALFAVLLVGIGRLYLGVHWPTDVLGGWAIGFAVSAAAMAWLKVGLFSSK